MRRFIGDYYELVNTIARGAKNNNITAKESFNKFLDLVEFWSIMEPLENANKTVENLFEDVKECLK